MWMLNDGGDDDDEKYINNGSSWLQPQSCGETSGFGGVARNL